MSLDAGGPDILRQNLARQRQAQVHESHRCPECRAWMQVGYINVSSGLLWLAHHGASTGDFAESIPGTNAIMRPNRLPAWKCTGCELLTLRFGREVHKQLPPDPRPRG